MKSSSRSGCQTQRITGADLAAGRIRIPSINTSSAKSLLPDQACEVTIVLRGRELRCAWDPRMGPDRQRSGVLKVGRALSEIVNENDILNVAIADDGRFTLE